MAKDIENGSYTVCEEKGIGNVKIADEVVCVIAAIAVLEVEGVECMTGNIVTDNVHKIGYKALSKGIKVEIGEDAVKVFTSLTLKYGYSIPDVSAKVQDRVATAIKNMTGMSTEEVNIKIDGVKI